jgi:hypothetical protein
MFDRVKQFCVPPQIGVGAVYLLLLIQCPMAYAQISDGDGWNTGSLFAAGTQCETKGYMAQGQVTPLLTITLRDVHPTLAAAVTRGYQEGLRRHAIYYKNSDRWVAYQLTKEICSQIQNAVSQYNLAFKTIKEGSSSKYLAGEERAAFIARTTNGCMRDYGRDGTGVIPKPLFEKYCQCYANGLADNAAASDIKSENNSVMDPIVKAQATRCYAEIKQEALQNNLRKN